MPAAASPPLPPATALPYAAATSSQQALALAFLRRELAAHFPTLPDATWARVLAERQPELWVLADGAVELDWQDVTRLTQQLVAAPELPKLDPPVYGHYAHYLARRLQGFGQQAVRALAELEASPAGVGPRVYELLTKLAAGNATAAQVLDAYGQGVEQELALGRPVPADQQPGSPTVQARLQALARARGTGLYALLPEAPID